MRKIDGVRSWQPRHYTLEVSEEGRQWMLVHRCIVDPAKGEGDKVLPGEEHLTAAHQVRLLSGSRVGSSSPPPPPHLSSSSTMDALTGRAAGTGLCSDMSVHFGADVRDRPQGRDSAPR